MNGHAKSFDETKCKLFLSKMNCLKNIAKSGKTAKKIFRKKKKTKKTQNMEEINKELCLKKINKN